MYQTANYGPTFGLLWNISEPARSVTLYLLRKWPSQNWQALKEIISLFKILQYFQTPLYGILSSSLCYLLTPSHPISLIVFKH